MLAQGLPEVFGTITNCYLGSKVSKSSSSDKSSGDDSKERAQDKDRLEQINTQITTILGDYKTVDVLKAAKTKCSEEITTLTTNLNTITNELKPEGTLCTTYASEEKNLKDLYNQYNTAKANGDAATMYNLDTRDIPEQLAKVAAAKAAIDAKKQEAKSIQTKIDTKTKELSAIKSKVDELEPLLEEKEQINKKWQARTDDPESDAATEEFNQNLSDLTNFNKLLTTFNADNTDKKTAKKLKEIAENAPENKIIQKAYKQIKPQVESALAKKQTK